MCPLTEKHALGLWALAAFGLLYGVTMLLLLLRERSKVVLLNDENAKIREQLGRACQAIVRYAAGDIAPMTPRSGTRDWSGQ